MTGTLTTLLLLLRHHRLRCGCWWFRFDATNLWPTFRVSRIANRESWINYCISGEGRDRRAEIKAGVWHPPGAVQHRPLRKDFGDIHRKCESEISIDTKAEADRSRLRRRGHTVLTPLARKSIDANGIEIAIYIIADFVIFVIGIRSSSVLVRLGGCSASGVVLRLSYLSYKKNAGLKA